MKTKILIVLGLISLLLMSCAYKPDYRPRWWGKTGNKQFYYFYGLGANKLETIPRDEAMLNAQSDVASRIDSVIEEKIEKVESSVEIDSVSAARKIEIIKTKTVNESVRNTEIAKEKTIFFEGTYKTFLRLRISRKYLDAIIEKNFDVVMTYTE